MNCIWNSKQMEMCVDVGQLCNGCQKNLTDVAQQCHLFQIKWWRHHKNKWIFFYKDIKSKFKIVLIIYRQGNFKVRFPTVLWQIHVFTSW